LSLFSVGKAGDADTRSLATALMAGDVDDLMRVVVADTGDYDRFYKKLIEDFQLKTVTSRFAMDLAAFILFALGLGYLISPFIALVKIHNLRQRVEELEKKLVSPAPTPPLFQPLPATPPPVPVEPEPPRRIARRGG
jgi:hypothetical protein